MTLKTLNRRTSRNARTQPRRARAPRVPAGATARRPVFGRRSRVHVRRIVLLSLVVAGVLVATVFDSSRFGSALEGPRGTAMTVLAPLQNGIDRAADPIASAATWVGNVFSAASANPGLERKVEELNGELVRLKAVEAENDRLRESLGLDPRTPYPPGVEPVAAEIVARSPGSLGRGFVIDRGSDHGVAVNDAVVTTAGLVGRVSVAGALSSRVVPIVASGEAVSVVTVETGAQGVSRLVSAEGAPVLDMAYVSTAVSVEAGNSVVTAGWRSGRLQSIYPAGIPVGTVSSVGASPADIYKTIQVVPRVDFERLTAVHVLTGSASATAHKPLPTQEDQIQARLRAAGQRSGQPGEPVRRTRGPKSRAAAREATQP